MGPETSTHPMKNTRKKTQKTTKKPGPTRISMRKQLIIQRLLREGMGVDGRLVHEDLP